MKDKSTPISGKGKLTSERPISAKRQAILAGAFAQLRIARKKIDPSILDKIRSIVKASPFIAQKLGVNKAAKVDADMPLSAPLQKTATKPAVKKRVQENPTTDYERIDQSKNMEVMAKLMQLSPDNREAIKAVIKKSET